MSISLAVALGINTIIVKSFRTTQEFKKAPPALHAADTGIEKALWSISKNEAGIGSTTSGTLISNDSDFEAEFEAHIISPTSSDPKYDCPDDSMYCIYSSGVYEGSRRYLKVIR